MPVVGDGKGPPYSASTPDGLEAAFVELRSSLSYFLRRRVPDPALAEDLLQDVFVKAAVAIREGRGPENLKGWLHAVARTAVADHFRSSSTKMIALDGDQPDNTGTGDELLHHELATCMRPLVEQLPAIYRDTLRATDLEGKTMKVVAADQGVTVSAIKSRVSRARHRLREQLLACCEVETSGGLVSDYRRRGDVPGGTCCN